MDEVLNGTLIGGLKSVSGVVDGVIFKNSDNGYIVLELDCDGTPVIAVGNLGDIAPGEKLSLTGDYITSPKYGDQFKAVSCERARPDTPEEIAKYLGSGIIPGIGIKTALRITDKFGESTLDMIESNPERLCEIKGITMDKAVSIGAMFRKMCGVNTVLEFLNGFGISPAASVAVWNRYDSSSIALIKENPFLLCDEGIELDFDAVDKIAESFGVDPFCNARVKAGIAYVLLENARIGHTCLPEKPLGERVAQHLGISRDAFDIALHEGIEERRFAICGEYVYLSAYYKAERYITDKLNQMLKMNAESGRDFSDEIAVVEFEESISYETLQKTAIEGCLKNNLFILTGGPGTGKTTTLNAVIRLLKQDRKLLSLAAPTGRAAKRMSELTGQPAQTIHRLLEVDVSNDNMTKFKKNEMNPLKADVIIIDEMSMVDALLFESLLRAIKVDAKLIMAGDSDQLPSVGAGNVLADLIACDKIEQVRLIEIFRQSQESLIVTNAHKIVSGKLPELGARDKDFFFMACNNINGENDIAAIVTGLVKTRLPTAYGFDPVDDIQVLSPTKMGPAGTRELNKALQSAINPASVKKREVKHGDVVFRIGDKVMQNTNDYNIEWKRGGERGMGVYNGDIGIITGIDSYAQNSGGMTVNFDGRVAVIPARSFNKIEHAYAITVHKSQGSEYKAVILPVPAVTKRLLYRSLLYTGVTRARDLLILVGKHETIAEMVNNERKGVRFSCLQSMMAERGG
ncbi:MAG: ATP-dependent RecD-like DNA helicase [Oscillospiraceae bacterium]|nr:ATP-dependent RecD-like DNA helicase [Oscillospiraceae bacterium]